MVVSVEGILLFLVTTILGQSLTNLNIVLTTLRSTQEVAVLEAVLVWQPMSFHSLSVLRPTDL